MTDRMAGLSGANDDDKRHEHQRNADSSHAWRAVAMRLRRRKHYD